MLKNKAAIALAGVMALVGAVGGTALLASAQTASTSTNTPVVTNTSNATSGAVDKPESPNDPADTDTGKAHGHAPLGGDGVVSSISGTTIVVGEESDEGGASYTVDASKATFSNKDGAAATIADIKVGDKIFVQGTVNGTNVSATSISLGHPHDQGDKGNDANETNEANDGPDSGANDASQ